ncbi:related to Alkaline ceramidase YDC1 [Hanseniaspora guilliermondii]|uniref:Related to Alkaline ceramidase YDC1 n=1 Tax=Hanseniaspora guilliermondii TaxID=56406 RepID=A0A1L0B0T8_9ASCO|nr:related to Alkaline ceramidase YDC1 [Hanseniaspora guilliermondii]
MSETLQHSPIWGNITSTIDWCEENYVQSSFIAEFCNTISNLSYVFVSFYLFYSLKKIGISELRFKLTMLGLLLVGIGSAMFHMSLRYDCQLLDELPMIYITCIPCYSVLSEPFLYYSKLKSQKYFQILRNDDEATSENSRLLPNNNSMNLVKISKSYEIFIIILLSGLSIVMTIVYYFFITNPIFHEVCYGLLNFIIVYAAVYLTKNFVKEPYVKKNLIKSSLAGIALFGTGFFLWGMDRKFCGEFRTIRRDYLKLPLGNILELHAWWHIFTGLGLYYILTYLIFLRINLHNQIKGDVYYGSNYKMHWIGPFKLIPTLTN